MGRHRAPDDGEPVDEPSDDYPGPEDFEDAGGYREPGNFPADEPPYTDSFSAPRYPNRPPEEFHDDLDNHRGFFDFDDPADDPRDEFARPEQPERDLPPADIDPPDDFPGFPRRGQGPPTPPPPSQTGGHRGLPEFAGGHRNEDSRRGVSIGVIAALITVVVVVGVI